MSSEGPAEPMAQKPGAQSEFQSPLAKLWWGFWWSISDIILAFRQRRLALAAGLFVTGILVAVLSLEPLYDRSSQKDVAPAAKIPPLAVTPEPPALSEASPATPQIAENYTASALPSATPVAAPADEKTLLPSSTIDGAPTLSLDVSSKTCPGYRTFSAADLNEQVRRGLREKDLRGHAVVSASAGYVQVIGQGTGRKVTAYGSFHVCDGAAAGACVAPPIDCSAAQTCSYEKLTSNENVNAAVDALADSIVRRLRGWSPGTEIKGELICSN
jgi:hypothetical protein